VVSFDTVVFLFLKNAYIFKTNHFSRAFAAFVHSWFDKRGLGLKAEGEVYKDIYPPYVRRDFGVRPLPMEDI